MFEKFQKLFFEEEEFDDEEYDEEEYEEVKPAKKKEKGSLFGKRSGGLLAIDDDDDGYDDDEDLPVIVKKEESPLMQTRSISTKAVVEQEPIVESKVELKPAIEVKVEEEKVEKSFGLSVDEIAPSEEIKPRTLSNKELNKVDSHVSTKQNHKPFTSATINDNPYNKKTSSNEFGGNFIKNTKRPSLSTDNSTYLFSPVISPMFGVNEKAMNSFNETRKIVDEQMELREMSHSEPKQDTMEDLAMKRVISPMYGSNLVNPVIEAVEASNHVQNDEEVVEAPKIQPLDGSNSVQYQSLDDLIKEGRNSATEENLEATKAFKFEDLLTDDEPVTPVAKESESRKTVESPFSAYNLFSDIEESDE